MKVFNLRCPLDHVFEGWFASETEFEQQKTKGWLSCPMCGSSDIVKGLSAPHVSRKSNTVSPPATPAARMAGEATAPPETLQRIQQAWLAFSREVVEKTEDVGTAFPAVVRNMHAGEEEHRAVRGVATPEERRELAEEGIDVVPLLLAEPAKHKLQ